MAGICETSRMRRVSRNRRCGSARYVADVSISTGKYRLPPGLALWRESYPIVAHRFPRSQGRAGRGNPRLCSQTLLSLVCHDRFIRSVPRCTRIQGKGKKGIERERERFVDCRRMCSCLYAILIRWVAWLAMRFRCGERTDEIETLLILLALGAVVFVHTPMRVSTIR